jgi:hypothetical protein
MRSSDGEGRSIDPIGFAIFCYYGHRGCRISTQFSRCTAPGSRRPSGGAQPLPSRCHFGRPSFVNGCAADGGTNPGTTNIFTPVLKLGAAQGSNSSPASPRHDERPDLLDRRSAYNRLRRVRGAYPPAVAPCASRPAKQHRELGAPWSQELRRDCATPRQASFLS